MDGLVLKRVTNMHLLVGKCPNRHWHIFGFYHQLRDDQKIIDVEAMQVHIRDNCRDCGCAVEQSLALCWSNDVFTGGAGI